MLPFRVIQTEQHKGLQQNAAGPLPPNPSLLSELSLSRNFAASIRQTPQLLLRQDLAAICYQSSSRLTQKNERLFAKWAPTSNRFWVKNRCYRKRSTKPRLTGARTHIRLSLTFTKIAQGADELYN
jgi:hypothetical protein